MKFIDNLKHILFEDIYGNKAIVYHRTAIENLIDKIYSEGFKPGSGEKYGKGMYSTYKLDSQLNEQMIQLYGTIIIKFMINSLNRFLILDYEEFIKAPISKKIKTNKDNFIYDQMKYFNFNKLNSFKEKIEDLNKQESLYSSDIASKIHEKYKPLSNFVDGIIFNGRNDGLVLVCYNMELIIPLSFSQDEGITWTKTTNKNIDYLKRIFLQNTDNIKFENIKSDFTNQLIKKNKIQISKNSKFLIKENYIDWWSGSWYEGIWEKGLWRDGTWYDGTWEKGTWEEGIWKKGLWRDGTWEEGNWEKGTWKEGTWKSGIWKDGTWENGTWHDGIWEKGTWKDGAWYKGTWLGGYDKFSNFHHEGDSPNKWILKDHWIYSAKISKDSKYKIKDNIFTWEDGVWHSGTWEKGIFLKGTWEKGTWEYGTFGDRENGVWKDGTFKSGNFRGKLWKNGNFNGVWLSGVWENGVFVGIWESGTWLGGKWMGNSIWSGGYDKFGNYHEEDDSPDKWDLK